MLTRGNISAKEDWNGKTVHAWESLAKGFQEFWALKQQIYINNVYFVEIPWTTKIHNMWHNKTVPFTWSAHQDNWLRYSAFCKVLSQAVKIERNVTSAWVRTRQTKETWLVVKTSSYIITSHHNGWIAARCGMVVQNKKFTYRVWVLKQPHQSNCIVCWLFCQLHVRTEVSPWLCGINVKCEYTPGKPTQEN